MSLSDIREFLVINLGEVKDKQFQLSEPKRRVLKLPVTSHRFVKNYLQKAKRHWSTGRNSQSSPNPSNSLTITEFDTTNPFLVSRK